MLVNYLNFYLKLENLYMGYKLQYVIIFNKQWALRMILLNNLQKIIVRRPSTLILLWCDNII